MTSIDTYTATGDKNGFGGMLMRWSNLASYVPTLGAVPATFFGFWGTVVDTVKLLLRGQFASALTAAASGAVATYLNVESSAGGVLSPVYWANVASGVFTSGNLGTHGRAATERVIGTLARPLGIYPTVLSSHLTGVSGLGGTVMPARPGRHTTRVAQERRKDPNAMWADYCNGEGSRHIAELTGSGLYAR